jgi:serine/threonine protein kinase
MPLGLRAPEAILGGPISEKVDIWAFGCLIYEFLTARQLFPVYWYETGAQLDDAHLLHITLQICPLPDKLFEKWSRRHRYFGPNRELISTEVDADDKNVDDGKISTPRIKLPVTLDEKWLEGRPRQMGDKEAAQVLALLRWTLQPDPEKRPTTTELLDHGWFESIDRKTN